MLRALDFAAIRRALRRTGDAQILAPLAGLIAAALVIIGAAVYAGSVRQDAVQRESEERIVASSISTVLRTIASNARDYAWWDDAVRHLVLSLDPDWAAMNIEPLHSSLGYDVSFAIAGDGRTIYGLVDGERTETEAERVLGPGLRELIARAGETPDGEPLPAAAILEGESGLFAASVSLIVPQNRAALTLPAGPRAILAVGKRLNERFLAELQEGYGLNGLALAPAGQQPRSASVELHGPGGALVRRIVWEPRRPGGQQLSWLIPSLLVSLAVLAIFTSLVLRAIRQSTAAIRQSEMRYRAIVQDQTEVICRYLPDSTLTFVNDAYCRSFDQPAEALIGRKFLDFVPEAERAEMMARILALRPGEATSYEILVPAPDGTMVWQHWTDRAIGDPIVEYQAVGRDVTERKRAEAAAQAAAEQTALVLTAGRMGTWHWDALADRLTWDDTQCRLFGLEPDEAPRTLASFLSLVHPEDRGRLEQVTRADEPFEDEFRILHADGSIRWIAERGIATHDASGRIIRMLGVNYDTTERKAAEERIRELALTDPLTGLPNRRTLQELLTREMARAARGGPVVALLLVDLDDFKRINDTLGHAAGDTLLAEVARRLQASVREGDIVARIGGDEFAVLATAEEDGGRFAALAERLVEKMDAPVQLHGTDVRAGASVGLATFPGDAADAGALLAHADLALYAAKAAGRGTWRPFHQTMQEQVRSQAALERDLRTAFERNELSLHYQPIIRVDGLELQGFEALLRWNHPDKGPVSPTAFLAAAERDRLIIPLTFWTLAEALRHAAEWRAAGMGEPFVSVNLGARVLDAAALGEHVEQRLAAEEVPARTLVVEVTEGSIADSRGVVATLEGLRRLGVRVAVDDFGAGYSSLARLRDLPLDLLKVDRAFLAAPFDRGEAILRAIVALAKGLDLPTVAEGVETAEQLALLRRVGISCAQGYLLARPMAAAEVLSWARTWGEGRLRDPALDLLRRAGR